MTNMQTIRGAEIRPLLKEMMADPSYAMTFRYGQDRSAEVGRTWLYAGHLQDPKSKKIMQESGKYLTVYAKQADGSWKIVDDINNPDAPAVPVDAKE